MALAERQLAVDRAAVELNTDNDAVRIRAITRLLELVAAYEDDPAFQAEWRDFPRAPSSGEPPGLAEGDEDS